MLTISVYDSQGIKEAIETNDPFRSDGTLRAPFARFLLDAAMQDEIVVFSPGRVEKMPIVKEV